MEVLFCKKVYHSVESKIAKIEKDFLNYALRAMMAGMFLCLVYSFVTQLNADFINTGHPVGIVIGKFLMAFFFGLALVLIVYSGSELFTSNTMYFSLGFFHKKVNIKRVLKILVVCYIFNFIGTLIMAFIISKTNVFAMNSEGVFANEYLFQLAAKKTQLDPSEVFFKGILANLVVNIVVYIVIVCKEDIAKIFIMLVGIMPFVYLGFEHSIANFSVFLLTMLHEGATSVGYHGVLFSNSGMISNLVFSTLGNIIGGAVFIGGYYAFLHRKNSCEPIVE